MRSVRKNSYLIGSILTQQEEDYCYPPGLEPPRKAGRQTRRIDRKEFIYRERILNPLLFPFEFVKMQQRPGVRIMENNAPAHKHHYHDQARAELGLTRIVWHSGTPDLNPIVTIWNEMKDNVKARLDVVLRKVWQSHASSSTSDFEIYLYLVISRRKI